MAYKVLVIDDEPDVLKYLESVLSDGGYEVKTAESGKDGFEKACEWSPDLICLDIMMPKQSGISVYRQMREDKKTCNIPVIILTGIEKGDDFDFHAWVGDDELPPPEQFLEKPIKVSAFLETIGKIIGSGKVESK
ncbi:MAG TPA: response regulator [candidate division Zixibacteria bacterium]|nr:response regulator [candidate division Zixibacteria bacterium]HER00275.1 response regulator [candidate division Zixibacteria bacterium]